MSDYFWMRQMIRASTEDLFGPLYKEPIGEHPCERCGELPTMRHDEDDNEPLGFGCKCTDELVERLMNEE